MRTSLLSLFTVLLITAANPASGSVLIQQTHHSDFELKAGQETVSFWLPLPMDYETQVPLSVSIEVSPKGLSPKFVYSEDEIGNLGVHIQFEPSTSSRKVSVHGEFLVMTHDQIQNDRHEFYNRLGSSDEWARGTPVVDVDYAPIKNQATDFARQSRTAGDFFTLVQKWFKSEFTYGAMAPYRLDSIGAFDHKKTTCTGFANLAAALGRAAGIPTRTLAGYMVGIAQQTHSINEYFMGPGVGWWRIEPQIVYPSLPEEYFLLVRVNRASDEGSAAFEWLRPGMIPRGVPLWSLRELSGQADRIQGIHSNHFPESPNTDNKAVIVRRITESPLTAKRLFFEARSLWKRDWAELRRTSALSDGVTRLRGDFYGVQSLRDIERLLGRLR